VDVDDIDKRKDFRALLLCNWQLHIDAMEIFWRDTLLTKVDYECSHTLYKALLHDYSLMIPDTQPGNDFLGSIIRQQKFHLHVSMYDAHQVTQKKRVSFLIIGRSALHDFLESLASRELHLAVARLASDPRLLLYSFCFMPEMSGKAKQIALETSLCSTLVQMWWEFEHVEFHGALLSSLVADTAREVRRPRGQDSAGVQCELARLDELATSSEYDGRLLEAIAAVEQYLNLIARTKFTTIPPGLAPLCPRLGARYMWLTELHIKVAKKESVNSRTHARAAIANVRKWCRLKDFTQAGLRWDKEILTMQLLEGRAYLLLGKTAKACELIELVHQKNLKLRKPIVDVHDEYELLVQFRGQIVRQSKRQTVQIVGNTKR